MLCDLIKVKFMKVNYSILQKEKYIQCKKKNTLITKNYKKNANVKVLKFLHKIFNFSFTFYKSYYDYWDLITQF